MSSRYINTERVGVNAIESIFLNEFNWIFREQPIVDMGIDAQVEYVNKDGPTGKLLGIQIKSGSSHFHQTDKYYVYYLDETHFNYWMNHSLPVLLIGYFPEMKQAVWQYIDKSTVKKTKKKWKVVIPRNQILNELTSKHQIEDIIKTKSLDGKINKLFFDKELIKFLDNRNRIILYTEEWLHKSLGRGPFKVILINEGKEEVTREWMSFYTYSLEKFITKIFPWADFGIDSLFYKDNLHPSVFEFYSKDYLFREKIYPYKIGAGEVGFYRIQLAINKIGKAFLDLEEYLETK